MANNTKKRKSPGTFTAPGRGPFIWIVRIVVVVFIACCLFGVINQVAMGKSAISFFVDTGTAIGNEINYIFTGDKRAPLDITDEGVYVDGYAPDGATNIIEKSAEENNTQ